MMMRLTCTVVLLGVFTTTAKAQPGDDPRRDFDQGTTALQEGRFAEARTLLRRAHQRSPRPATAFNLAIALTGTGEVVQAVALFDGLVAGEFGSISEEVTQQAKERRQLARQAVARLQILVTPPIARIRIDGTPPASRGPTGTQINPGRHLIDVSLEGYRAAQHRLDIDPGEERSLTVRLQKLPPPPKVEKDGSLLARPWFWVITGVVVAAGTAAAVGLTAGSSPDRPDVDATIFTLR